MQATQLSPDARLARTLTLTHNLHELGVGEALSGGAVAGGALVAGALRIENEAGAWEGPLMGLRRPDEPWAHHSQVLLEGDGDYEGMRALLYYEGEVGDAYGFAGSQAVEGFIFSGDMPAPPDSDE